MKDNIMIFDVEDEEEIIKTLRGVPYPAVSFRTFADGGSHVWLNKPAALRVLSNGDGHVSVGKGKIGGAPYIIIRGSSSYRHYKLNILESGASFSGGALRNSLGMPKTYFFRSRRAVLISDGIAVPVYGDEQMKGENK